jgi:hypothetical protein
VLADIWPTTQRGPALLLWGLTITIGPLIAPIIGGALVIAEPTVGWRWTEYVRSLHSLCTHNLGLMIMALGYRHHYTGRVCFQRHMDRRKLSTGPSRTQSPSHSSGDQELGCPRQERRNRNNVQGDVSQVSHRAVRDDDRSYCFLHEYLLCFHLRHHLSVRLHIDFSTN